jgi:hypothetical protein
VNLQPVVDNKPLNALYFVAFVILGGFFWGSLLVGAIIDNYRRIAAASGDMIFTTVRHGNILVYVFFKAKELYTAIMPGSSL